MCEDDDKDEDGGMTILTATVGIGAESLVTELGIVMLQNHQDQSQTGQKPHSEKHSQGHVSP